MPERTRFPFNVLGRLQMRKRRPEAVENQYDHAEVTNFEQQKEAALKAMTDLKDEIDKQLAALPEDDSRQTRFLAGELGSYARGLKVKQLAHKKVTHIDKIQTEADLVDPEWMLATTVSVDRMGNRHYRDLYALHQAAKNAINAIEFPDADYIGTLAERALLVEQVFGDMRFHFDSVVSDYIQEKVGNFPVEQN